MTEDDAETCLASQYPAHEAISGPLENACIAATHDSDVPQYDTGEKLPRLARLSEESPDLRESIRECELLSQILTVHSQISGRISAQLCEEADSIGRGSPLFTL